MAWGDYLFDRGIASGQLATLLAEFLSIPLHHVAIVESVTSVEVDATVQMLCERRVVHGDFVLHLSPWPRSALVAMFDGTGFVEMVCDRLKCRCLISDATQNPFTYILVEGSARRRPVSLDPERMKLDPVEFVISPL